MFWVALRRALGAYNSALAASPLPTKIATGGVLATSGDLLAQSWEPPEKPFDPTRSLSMFAFGTIYAGGFQHFLFGWYSRIWPIQQAVDQTQRLALAAKTTAFQQLVLVPTVYFPSFIGITSVVRGHDPFAQWRAHFWPNYKVRENRHNRTNRRTSYANRFHQSGSTADVLPFLVIFPS